MENKVKILSNGDKQLQYLNNKICESLKQIISHNVSWSDEEINTCFSRIQEVYHSVIPKNVTQKPKSANTSDVFLKEQSSNVLELRKELNQEVMPKLDDKIIETTKKRKHVPFQCTQWKAKQCKYDVMRVQDMKAEVIASPLPDPVDDQSHKETTLRDLGSSATIKQGLKNSSNILNSLEKTNSALHMLNAQFHSSTDRILCHPDPTEHVMHTSTTPLKRKLQNLGKPNSSVYNSRMSQQKAMVKIFDVCFPRGTTIDLEAEVKL